MEYTSRRLRFAILVVMLLIGFGTLGYMRIEGWSLLDSLYMTVITLTAIGYEVVEPLTNMGKIFTIVLALSGVFIIFTVVLIALGDAVEIATSEKMQHMFWRRRMEKTLKGIKDHYIICGYGRMGQAIANEFRARKIPFVVIENNPEQLPKLVAEKATFVEGDASEEESLLAAGVERAKGLITVAPTDADNTFIALSAKSINPNLYVVARSIKVEDEAKLRRAGADRVMSPYILGGKRMAWAVLRPTVVDFLESAVYGESLEIGEIKVHPTAPFVNAKILESNIRGKSGATIIAMKKRDGTLISSPSPDMEIQEGDILVVVGTPAQLEALEHMT